MRRLLLASTATALVFAACANSQTPDASRPPSPTVATSASASPSVTSGDAASAGTRVRVESPFPGGVEIFNDADVTVRIQWDLPIERDDGGAWKSAHGMTMMPKCFEGPPAEKCVSIAAHTSYKPLPWTGWIGCTQCGSCRGNVPARPGRYRVVAVDCDSAEHYAGPAMTIASEGRFAKTPHVYAPSDDPATIVIDNEADEPVSFRVAVDVAKLDASRGAYDTVEHAGMLLSPDCFPDAGANACITIPAHGTLRSMSFRPGCPRCAMCTAQSVKPGTYMHTVQLCDGSKPFYNAVYGYTFRTPAFVVDAHGTAKPER